MKEIPGFPRYLATENGDIYSLRRARTLAPAIHPKNGYQYVQIPDASGRLITCRVHRLVCSAYHGPAPSGTECSHLDGDRQNNCPTNLRWESRSQNHRRKIGHGTHDRGCCNSRAKLTPQQLAMVRQELSAGKMTHAEIGAAVGVSRAFISKIKGGSRYA